MGTRRKLSVSVNSCGICSGVLKVTNLSYHWVHSAVTTETSDSVLLLLGDVQTFTLVLALEVSELTTFYSQMNSPTSFATTQFKLF